MRICVVQSSYEGTNSPFEKLDSMPDPGYYVDKTQHTFHQRYIRKTSEKTDIDRIVAEGFDMYMNFMWGQINDSVAGIEAIRYLESKGVTVMLSPSDFMQKTKVDFKEAADRQLGFRVPGNTPGRYPKIVKYADGLASIGMDDDSVCYNDRMLEDKITALKIEEPRRDVIIQDFIRGIETTAIVVEMGADVVALPPVDWIFARDLSEDQAWLKHSTKFESLAQGTVHFEYVADVDRRERICDAAVAAFKGLGMQGHGAWGRLDARVENGTGLVYCLEMNHMPALFYGANDALSDDFIIKDTYPGGHSAFIDMLLFTKKFQMTHDGYHSITKNDDFEGSVTYSDGAIGHQPSKERINGMHTPDSNDYRGASHVSLAKDSGDGFTFNEHLNTTANGDQVAQRGKLEKVPPKSVYEAIGDFKARGVTIAAVYDSSVDKYEAVQEKTPIRKWEVDYFQEYEYHGKTLDLACGTGTIGMLIKESSLNASIAAADCMIHGVDVSPLSLQTPRCKQYYDTTQVGYIQEVIMSPDSSFFGKSVSGKLSSGRSSLTQPVDHITCFGALHFLTRTEFNATLSRMFMLARHSVCFDVDDVSEEYIELIVNSYGEGLRNHNNIAAYREFGTPPGWKKVLEVECPLFHSPSVKLDVRGIIVRFERTSGTSYQTTI